MAHAFLSTRATDTRLVFVVDSGRKENKDYRAAVKRVGSLDVTLRMAVGGTMVRALNEIALDLIDDNDAPESIGFMGDDHFPRTKGWDSAYISAIREMGGVGIVYGDDTVQHEFVPTQCAMSSNIIRTLGWMSPPQLKHMYVDTIWRDIGNLAGCLRYLPDVIVEHVHPVTGAIPRDAAYDRVEAFMKPDEEAFWKLRENLPAWAKMINEIPRMWS
jgi:hypothetical protein